MLSCWQHSTLRGNCRKADTHLGDMHHSNTYWLHNVICKKLLTRIKFLVSSQYLICTIQVSVQSKGSVSLTNTWEHILGLLIKSADVNSCSKAFCAQRIMKHCCFCSEGSASFQTCSCTTLTELFWSWGWNNYTSKNDFGSLTLQCLFNIIYLKAKQRLMVVLNETGYW